MNRIYRVCFPILLLLTWISGPIPSAMAAPSNLPHTASTFTGAKKALYDQIYRDHRVTFYWGL